MTTDALVPGEQAEKLALLDDPSAHADRLRLARPRAGRPAGDRGGAHGARSGARGGCGRERSPRRDVGLRTGVGRVATATATPRLIDLDEPDRRAGRGARTAFRGFDAPSVRPRRAAGTARGAVVRERRRELVEIVPAENVSDNAAARASSTRSGGGGEGDGLTGRLPGSIGDCRRRFRAGARTHSSW